MTPVESLHYAIGELAYAVARADGKIQNEEREKFQNIVAVGLRCKDYAFNVADIVFQIMDKDRVLLPQDAYKSALNEIRLNSHYLSPELKTTFIRVMEKVAKAYKPVTIDEQALIEKFKKDIEPIHGDPVYYK
ncbi:MAG: TerB family tellurite resistance protein [Bacteroidota bacterium]